MTRPISRLHRSHDDDQTGVQQLLATLPDPGPMPPDLIERITASLEAERAQHGPGFAPGFSGSGSQWDRAVSGGSHAVGDDGMGLRGGPDGPTLPRPRSVSRGWLLGLSTAAAAAAIGGVAALNMLGPADPGGSLAYGHIPVEGTASRSAQPSVPPSALPDKGGQPTIQRLPRNDAGPVSSKVTAPSAEAIATHIQVSSTAYTRATLRAQARHLWNHPHAELQPLGAESPAIGPIGTTVGVAECLAALGLQSDRAIVDLALYDGVPAAIVVTDGAGGRQVRVVTRQCGAQSDAMLAGPATVP